ncbi:Pc22g21300 [Rhizoctonia solani]|uniref:Pc22g21300 n=1 Tax=Rhizoctonia solani TaxID=456999 RepID=A0A0K6GI28_9AGAM|nr:Pc22g21300 [Rhizoctonia solani]
MEANIAALSKYQINNFFSENAPMTSQECDQHAQLLIGISVHASPVQGGTSYTVVSDDNTCVIQFRADSYALDMDFLQCVEQTYSGFTARHEYVGKLGKLHVYRMNNVGGAAMYLAREQLTANNCFLLLQTVSDYAKFFASAWNRTPLWMTCPDRDSLYTEYYSELRQLRQGLHARFHSTLDYLISMLPNILDKNWPMVPNHIDLLENNIHVDTLTGHITGICDWKDAVISPFGMSLGGLETMLGFATFSRGWRYHTNQQELRDLFWETFYQEIGGASEEQKKLIEVAVLVGLFLGHGFERKDEIAKVPASEGHHELRYLEAVTLTRWEQTGKR